MPQIIKEKKANHHGSIDYYIWVTIQQTKYPIFPNMGLLGIFQVESERDRMAAALEPKAAELAALIEELENMPPGMGRAKPSTKKEKILNTVQKSLGIKDT